MGWGVSPVSAAEEPLREHLANWVNRSAIGIWIKQYSTSFVGIIMHSFADASFLDAPPNLSSYNSTILLFWRHSNHAALGAESQDQLVSARLGSARRRLFFFFLSYILY